MPTLSRFDSSLQFYFLVQSIPFWIVESISYSLKFPIFLSSWKKNFCEKTEKQIFDEKYLKLWELESRLKGLGKVGVFW